MTNPLDLLWVPMLLVAVPLMAGPPMQVVFSLVAGLLIAGSAPEFEAYQRFGYSADMWRRDRRLQASVRFLAACVPVVVTQRWWLVVAPALGLVWVLARRAEPRRGSLEDLVEGSEGSAETGILPVTPAVQLVVRPLLRLYLLVAVIVVTISLVMLAVVSRLAWLPALVTVGTLAGTVVLLSELRSTLSSALTFHLSRAQWGRGVVLVVLAGIPVALLGELIAYLFLGRFLGGFLFFALVAGPVLVGVEFVSRQTLVDLFAIFAVTGTLLYLWVGAGMLSAPWALMLAALTLVAWAAYLPGYARRIDTYKGGFSGLLGA
ncbi:hypothetical protein [Corynebacterium sp.]|uniref:hypothetical protein n=1 Tax=Corynebacterium sp. TaxID=1720 RepID=UPI0026DA8D31|nr:hypothetical protein [Corynebacterium sp.]MDO5033203.1 hypothetical protein [Corynebacterium sp.]